IQGASMRVMRQGAIAIAILGVVTAGVAAEGLDVTVKAPGITVYGQSIPTGDLQTELDQLKEELETDEDLQKFTDQTDLARAFANAGAASTHLATQRSFSDYRMFALVVGSGAAIAAPGTSAGAIEDSLTDFEDEGDAYFGAAIQPITVSFGVNLSRWVDRLRVNGKFGYVHLAEGDLVDDISFTSTTIGVGADYQIIGTRSIAAGVLRWRGVSLGSGINYQSNKTEISVEVQEEAFSESVTFDDFGFSDTQAQAAGYDDAEAELGSLTVSPTLGATVESRSWSIPLEASTGLRVLYLFDFNVGAGVDIALGSSEVLFGAESEIDFEGSNAEVEENIEVDPGSVDLGVSTDGNPQFLRPRLTAGVGLNLGPVKVDVPLMYYLDIDGPTAMVGVNLGIVW
ncbi:MAG: Lsa36 family surface (lipo)protein, partial [Alkalispirochaeta sp.]